MFLKELFSPQIAYGSGGGGSGGGGSSSRRRSAPAPTPVRSSGGKGSKPAPAPKPKAAPVKRGRNLDADMYAGSTYKKQADGSYKSPTSVTAKDFKDKNYTEFKAKSGSGSVVVARGSKLSDVPQVGTRPNSQVYNDKDVMTANSAITAPSSDSGASKPVAAPERLDETSGVGGGRDGGGSAKRKASKTSEDKVTVDRKAEGVGKYKSAKTAKKNNPMAIKKNRGVA